MAFTLLNRPRLPRDDQNSGSNPGVQVVDGANYYCMASVRPYVDSFVSEMHNLRPGGSPGSMQARVMLPPISRRRIQMQYGRGREKGVTVWNQGHEIHDKLWPSWQRIHQYKEDHAEIWGGAALTIDSDIVDAPIVPSIIINGPLKARKAQMTNRKPMCGWMTSKAPLPSPANLFQPSRPWTQRRGLLVAGITNNGQALVGCFAAPRSLGPDFSHV